MRSLGSLFFFTVLALVACNSSVAESFGDPDDDPSSPPGSSSGAPDGGTGDANASADGATGNGDGGPIEDPPIPYVAFDINHVISTGQSNSVANDGKPILSTTQPYSNLMFDVGVMTGTGCDGDGCKGYAKPSSFVPLVEGDTFFYPVETMSSGLANEATMLAKEKHGKDHTILVSLHGRSGNGYLCLRKGGCDWWPERNYVKPFEDGMRQVTDAKELAAAAGKSYVVRAVTAIHGEHDHYAYSANASHFPMTGTDGQTIIKDYGEALEEWQRDYESSVKAITGQTIPVPLFVQQYSHWNDVPTTKIAYQQLDAHVRSKGKVVVIGPTYHLPYSNNCLHFTNHGERWLGEYFAKAYTRVVVEGKKWEPLRPVAVSLANNVVTLKLHVPAPPLVLDTTRVVDPGSFGFEWSDESGAPPAVTKVEITGADTITITLASAPTGPNKRLRYAYTFGGCGGPKTLARGNVRDSDATASKAGYELFNWLVHFDLPVP